MILKVCGLNNIENFEDLSRLSVDILGMVFYPKSPRCVDSKDEKLAQEIGKLKVPLAGVFVNESSEHILERAELFNFTYLQLHGQESTDLCMKLGENYKIIKAFRIGSAEDIKFVHKYEGVADLFLFDTRGEQAGGTGRKFDWDLLKEYSLDTPYLLSGGVGPEDALKIRDFTLPGFIGVDINSRFELYPGRKDVEKIKNFISIIK